MVMIPSRSLIGLALCSACNQGIERQPNKPKPIPAPVSERVLRLPQLGEFPEIEDFWAASLAEAERPKLTFDSGDPRFRRPSDEEWLAQGRAGLLLRLHLTLAKGQPQRLPMQDLKSELLRLQSGLLNSSLSPPFEVLPRPDFDAEFIPLPTGLTPRFFFEILPRPGPGLKNAACLKVRRWVHAVQLVEGSRPERLPLLALDCDVVLDPAPVEELGLTLNRFPLPIVYGKKNQFPFRKAGDLRNLRLLRQLSRKP
jgi:hypothetical protein